MLRIAIRLRAAIRGDLARELWPLLFVLRLGGAEADGAAYNTIVAAIALA